MAVNLQNVQAAPQFTGADKPKKAAHLSFQGQPALKADTVSFSGAEQVANSPAAKNIISKVVDFLKTNGGKVLEYAKKAIKFIVGLPAKLAGLIKKAPPPAA